MAGYPVIDPDGVDILNVDGSTTHYNLGDTVPLSKLISRRYSWLVERGYLSETEIGFGGTETDLTDVEYIGFNTATPYHTPTLGQITWNGEEGTLDLALANDVIYENGMKLFMPPTKNNSGVQINKGEFVMATGAQGDRITIAKAITDGSVDPQYMIGVAASNIPDGSETGLIIVYGILKGIDTDLWPVGTILYPDPTTPGWWTSTQPTAPSIKTSIAIVLRQHENTGRIYVRMTNGSVLGGTDSNVQFSTLADNDILTYDSTQEYWKNQNLAAAVDEVGGSITGLSNYLPLTGGTLTGDLIINKASPSFVLGGSESSGTAAVFFRTGSSNRWKIFKDGSTESGSNANSNLNIERFDDSGNSLGTVFQITRSTGFTTLIGDFKVNKASPYIQISASSGIPGLYIDSPSGAPDAGIYMRTGTVGRWKISKGGSETGSNAGSSFAIQAYDDSGSFLSTPLSITRSTGRATFSNVVDSQGFVVNTGAGTSAGIQFWTSGYLRWNIRKENTAESGSNVGSDLVINRYDDAGTNQGVAFRMARPTGAVTLTGNLIVNSTTDSTSTSTGAITTLGGVGIAKNLYVGTDLNVAGATTLTGSVSLNGSVTLSSSQHYIKNGTPTTLNFVKGSQFGYSSGYRAIVLGDTATSPNNVTVAIGYDPSTNVSGSFTGNGKEVLFRNAAEFMTPNSDNTSFIKPLKWDSSGNTTLLGTTLTTLNGTDATDSSSSTTGAFKTAGGLGVAKALYVGTTITATTKVTAGTHLSYFENYGFNLRAVAGGWAKGFKIQNAAGSANLGQFGTYGSNDTLSYLFVGLEYNDANVTKFYPATGNVTIAGALNIDSTTDSTSTTTGSIQTDGGLGVAKAAFIGNGATIMSPSAGFALKLDNAGSDGGTNAWWVAPTGGGYTAGDNKLVVLYNSASSGGSLLTIDGANLKTGIGYGNYNPSATLDVKSYLTTDIGLIVRGVLSQTANLQEWRNSTGTVLASVSPSGAFTAVTKSFDIEHPTKEGKRLRYGSLEGPENGVYVRGKNDSHVITLPDYWTGLVDPESITVQLTSNGKFQPLYVEDIKDNSVIVGGVEGEYFYFIQAERIDVDKLVVEYGD